MASAREIIKRRKSVSNICKITRTMEMIATARFKKAHDRAVGARPYTEKIAHLVSTLSAGGGSLDHPLLRENDESGQTVLLVLTSNRGLCGGYNGNVMRMATKEIKQIESEGQQPELRASGKKAAQYFKFIEQPAHAEYSHFDDKTTYAQVEELADELIGLYTRKEIDGVRVVYTRFISAAKFHPETLSLLPLTQLEPEQIEPAGKAGAEDFIFSPSAQEILSELIPTTVRTRLFQCFIDSRSRLIEFNRIYQ